MLKVPATQLIQGSELTEIEKEKEALNDELSDYKAKHLKFSNERKEWEKEKFLLMEDAKVMKDKTICFGEGYGK